MEYGACSLNSYLNWTISIKMWSYVLKYYPSCLSEYSEPDVSDDDESSLCTETDSESESDSFYDMDMDVMDFWISYTYSDEDNLFWCIHALMHFMIIIITLYYNYNIYIHDCIIQSQHILS